MVAPRGLETDVDRESVRNIFAHNLIQTALILAFVGAPVYLYMFELEASPTSLATHAVEVRFAFSNASERPNAMPGADMVEDVVSDAWIAFARTGNPNHPGIPEWPVYDLRRRPTLVFDVESKVVNDLRPIERQAHERFCLVR